MSKVHLRRLTAGDSAQVLAWRNSPEVAAFMYSAHRITEDEHARWLARTLAAPDRRHWIVDVDGADVGLVGVTGIDHTNGHGDGSYYLADPAVRGRGVGTAAEYLMALHAFEDLGLNKLWCEVLADNAPGWRLHERFGFTREALLRAHVIRDGTPCDVVGLGLLAREWPTVKAQALARLAAKGYAPDDLTLTP